jgi:endonuclease I
MNKHPLLIIICLNIKTSLQIRDLTPSLYCDVSGQYSTFEHIYPKSKINKTAHNDFHNIYRTSVFYNSLRSNYQYINGLNDSSIISHKNKKFVPRECDKGIIARALIYMSWKYGYKHFIDPNLLYNWTLCYKPTLSEYNHNLIVKKFQGYDNPFIMNYNKKDYRKMLQKLLHSHI